MIGIHLFRLNNFRGLSNKISNRFLSFYLTQLGNYFEKFGTIRSF